MKNSAFLAASAVMPPNLAFLESVFPRQAALPILQVGEVLGMAPQTVRNQLHAGTFPIPTFKQGARRMALKIEVAAYLDRVAATDPKPKRGARTKAERIKAAEAADEAMGGQHGGR